MLYLVSLSFGESLSLSVSNFQIPSMKVCTILNPYVFISRTKFIPLYIVTCAMEASSIHLDNSLTGLVISGLLCFVRDNNAPTSDLYMDCVFSFTLEISATFPLTNPGAKLFLGKTISSKSYNYAKERTSLHLAVQVCRVLA